jgi:hypothetical protein
MFERLFVAAPLLQLRLAKDPRQRMAALYALSQESLDHLERPGFPPLPSPSELLEILSRYALHESGDTRYLALKLALRLADRFKLVAALDLFDRVARVSTDTDAESLVLLAHEFRTLLWHRGSSVEWLFELAALSPDDSTRAAGVLFCWGSELSDEEMLRRLHGLGIELGDVTWSFFWHLDTYLDHLDENRRWRTDLLRRRGLP